MNGIKVEYDELTGKFSVSSQFDKTEDANENEQKIVDHVTSLIRDRFGAEDVKLERRSDDYLTLVRGDRDFMRLKFTDRAKWVSIAIDDFYADRDDPRFSAQKNKNQRYWKSSLSDLSDLDQLDDVICSAYSFELRKDGD